MHELRLSADELLRHINYTWSIEGVSAFNDIEEWHRGGVETYVCRGQMKTESGHLVDVIAKAFVGTGLLPQNQQNRWEERRRLLSNSVETPKVYALYPAMTIEAFIDRPFPNKGNITPALAFQAGKIAKTLSNLGFSPISMLSDLRVKDDVLYYVDFGSDLGEKGTHSDRKWIDQIRKEIGSDLIADFDHGLASIGINPS